MPRSRSMKSRSVILVWLLFFARASRLSGSAQTLAPGAGRSIRRLDLQTLTKKIDEQNTKIDVLSQQILKLEQQIPAPSGRGHDWRSHPSAVQRQQPREPIAAVPGNWQHPRRAPSGETLTSIAKAYGVTVGGIAEIQSHRKRPLTLQIGQTDHDPDSRRLRHLRPPRP